MDINDAIGRAPGQRFYMFSRGGHQIDFINPIGLRQLCIQSYATSIVLRIFGVKLTNVSRGEWQHGSTNLYWALISFPLNAIEFHLKGMLSRRIKNGVPGEHRISICSA